MSVKKPALGRGLDALFSPPSQGISAGPNLSPPPQSNQALVRQIPIDQVRPNPFQPRTEFDETRLQELAESIKARGILQPVVMRRRGEGFEIVAGERRWRAAQLAGLREVPVLLKDFSDQEMMEAALIENLQREDLNPVEEARAYERLITHFGITQEALAEALGKSRVAITNGLRLLKLPAEVLEMVLSGRISAGHARAILAVESPEGQIRLAGRVADLGLSVRETEELARTWSAKDRKKSRKTSDHKDVTTALASRLSERLMMQVKISPKSNGSGKVEVYYSTLEEFQRFCELVGLPVETS